MRKYFCKRKLQIGDRLNPDEQLKEEFEHIFGKIQGSFQPESALCLSGGGIRSATFGLGVLQGLSHAGALEKFHYLSTVSGGGYIGSWLSRWCVEQSALNAEGAPLAQALKSAAHGNPSPIQRLRSFSNYLSPTWGISLDALTVFTIFIRNMLFSLLVWIPFISGIAFLPRLAVLAGYSIRQSVPCCTGMSEPDRALAIAALLPPALAATVWLGLALVVLTSAPFARNNDRLEIEREAMARWAAITLYLSVGWALFFVVFAFLPLILLKTGVLERYPGSGGILAGVLVTATSLAGFWSHYRDEIRKTAADIRQALGRRLLDLAAGLALLVITTTVVLAEHVWMLHCTRWLGSRNRWSSTAFTDVMVPDSWINPLGVSGLAATEGVILVALATTTIFCSWFVGANRFSLHALYGNRLVRAYLGSARNNRLGPLTAFDAHDNVDMAQLPFGLDAASEAQPGHRLFHIINMTLNLTGRSVERLNWQERKSASFIATPLHSGAADICYARTCDYGKGGMTLGRAMTISGAAVSPNMGYHSSRLVTLIMTIFNVRLGWWTPNPRLVEGHSATDPLIGLGLNLREAFSGADEWSHWLNLSDGGHFDNLGLYEMIRRRCRLIVVVDATCDGKFEYADLFSAVRLAAVDFAVPIELPLVLPGQSSETGGMRVIHGRLRYSEADSNLQDGDLFVLKPILTGHEPPELLAYARASREFGNTFPHHSTLDQFYDETRFESYRRLGEFSAADLVAALNGKSAQGISPGMPAQVEAQSIPPAATQSGFDGLKTLVSQWDGRKLLAGAVATLAAAGAVTGATNFAGRKAMEWIGQYLPASTPEQKYVIVSPSDSVADIDYGSISGELSTANGALREIVEKIDQLHTDLQSLPWGRVDVGGPVNPPDLSKIDNDLQEISRNLKSRSPSSTVRFDPADLARITASLDRIDRTIASKQPVDLNLIKQELHDIAIRLGALAPRQNLRGQ